VYSLYAGLAKDANGLFPLNAPPYQQVNLYNHECTKTIDHSGLHAYCMTRYILSNSFEWALEEGKETCVMITHVDEFLKTIQPVAAAHGLRYVGCESCIYISELDGRVLEHDP